ncbi:MAG TPA: enoyl-CoA hydratase [Vicinamibacterales bacterium]|nr:enoyl-CoA hydratase [Vicinamibacterales bacterium]
MNSSDTRFTSSGPVGRLTFTRPETGNALTWAMYEALADACDRVDADRGIRVFVICAPGGVFCTGTDIRQFTTFKTGQDGLEYERRVEACLTRLEGVAVPTIAQVEGIAAGAGCAIALACDLRVCTAAARFGVPIARTLGNALSIENCARLVEHIGPGPTKDMLFTGRLLDAREASALGLVTRLAEPADIGRIVDELAETIARNAPLTIRAMKAALRQVSKRQQADVEGVNDLIAACYASHDFREGVAAFLAKRPPVFTGE